MTFEEDSKKYLTDHGLWPNEAANVFGTMTEAPGQESMADLWHDDIEGYPASVRAALRLALNRHAVEYIDAVKPQHFARPMFIQEEPPDATA